MDSRVRGGPGDARNPRALRTEPSPIGSASDRDAGTKPHDENRPPETNKLTPPPRLPLFLRIPAAAIHRLVRAAQRRGPRGVTSRIRQTRRPFRERETLAIRRARGACAGGAP